MPGNTSESPAPLSGHGSGEDATEPPLDDLGKSDKDALGAHGEELAARHLTQAGLQILERNWRCAEGELDIIARDGAALVVCEVKTRSGCRFGSPLEAVTPAKARRLRRLASRWLSERHGRFGAVRIDVVGVICAPGERARVEHIRGVC